MKRTLPVPINADRFWSRAMRYRDTMPELAPLITEAEEELESAIKWMNETNAAAVTAANAEIRRVHAAAREALHAAREAFTAINGPAAAELEEVRQAVTAETLALLERHKARFAEAERIYHEKTDEARRALTVADEFLGKQFKDADKTQRNLVKAAEENSRKTLRDTEHRVRTELRAKLEATKIR